MKIRIFFIFFIYLGTAYSFSSYIFQQHNKSSKVPLLISWGSKNSLYYKFKNGFIIGKNNSIQTGKVIINTSMEKTEIKNRSHSQSINVMGKDNSIDTGGISIDN